MRMFVAVEPGVDVVEQITEFLEPRRAADPTLRWTEPAQWHLTLAFLPEVTNRSVDPLVEGLARVAGRHRPFQVTVDGAGAFPSPERAKVLWLGATADPPGCLDDLATDVRAAANKAGAVVEGGRFRPHVTMARLRLAADATRWLRVLGSYAGEPWAAASIELVESHLGQGRGGHPRYESAASFPLG